MMLGKALDEVIAEKRSTALMSEEDVSGFIFKVCRTGEHGNKNVAGTATVAGCDEWRIRHIFTANNVLLFVGCCAGNLSV